jgi:hypothetical protein
MLQPGGFRIAENLRLVLRRQSLHCFQFDN